MGEKELREKYGGKLDKAINRAIRAECEGGGDALDLLAKLSGPAAYSGWTKGSGAETDEAKAYHKHLRNVVQPMEADVRKRWGLPPAKEPKKTAKKRAPRR